MRDHVAWRDARKASPDIGSNRLFVVLRERRHVAAIAAMRACRFKEELLRAVRQFPNDLPCPILAMRAVPVMMYGQAENDIGRRNLSDRIEIDVEEDETAARCLAMQPPRPCDGFLHGVDADGKEPLLCRRRGEVAHVAADIDQEPVARSEAGGDGCPTVLENSGAFLLVERLEPQHAGDFLEVALDPPRGRPRLISTSFHLVFTCNGNTPRGTSADAMMAHAFARVPTRRTPY